MKCIIILLSVFIVTIAVDVQDCGSKVGTFSNISITSCDGSVPVCILKRNTNVTVHIVFNTNVEVKAVKAVVHGVIQGLPVPYPIPNSDGCNNSGLTCPLASGATEDYTATFPVLHNYPKIHLTVKWELQNEAGDDIVCINIPAQIK